MNKKPILLLILISVSILLQANSKKKDVAQLFNEAKYNAAIELANRKIAADSTSFIAWYYKGLSQNALYKYSEAVISFENAVKLTQNKTAVLFVLGNSLESSGNDVEAIETYRKLISIDTLHISARVRLAQIYKSQKDYLPAIELFSDLVKIDTNNSYFYSQLAYCCNKFGFDEPVIGYYEKAVELNPNDLKSGRSLISELINSKHYVDATNYVDTFLIRFPNNMHLLKQKAFISAIGGNYLEAVKDFQYVVDLGDSSLFTCKYYGQSLYNNGEYEKAVFWLNRFLDAKPDDFQNQLIMGLACQHDYQYEKSIYHFNIALSLKYDKKIIARVYTETGNTLSKQGDFLGFRDKTGLQAPEKYKMALENYLLAVELLPNDNKMNKLLGIFYEDKLNDKKVALYYYKRYYKNFDTSTNNEYALIWIQDKITKLSEEVHFIGD